MDQQTAFHGDERARARGLATARQPRLSRCERVISFDGTNLFVRDWGEGPVFVFLAGWDLDSEWWQYVMLPLVDAGFRCVAFDRRGHGRSGDPGGGYDLDSLAEDMNSVMVALDLKDATLVGHSMGAAEAVCYIARCGADRCRGLALIAPVTPHGVNAGIFPQIRDAIAKDFPHWLRMAWRGFLTEDISPELDQWIFEKMSKGATLQALIECQRTATRVELAEELSNLSLPVLVIHGDKDLSAALDLTGRPTASIVSGARLEIYEGAPHGLALTHAERLSTDLARFATG